MVFTSEEVTAIVGVCIGFFSLVLSLVISERSLKKAAELNEKTLRQSEKNLLIQLKYEDGKKALFKLCEIVRKNEGYRGLKKETLDFLDSLEGQFTPEDVRGTIFSGFKQLDDYIQKNDPEEQFYSTPEYITWAEEQAEKSMIEQMTAVPFSDPFAMFEHQFSNKMAGIKKSLEREIKESLKKPIKK